MSFISVVPALWIVLFWPLVVPDTLAQVALTILMLTLLLLAWHYMSSDLITFWQGLHVVARATARNGSLLRVFFTVPVLLCVIHIAFLFGLEGLLRGREIPQLRWAGLCGWFALYLP